MKVRKYWRTYLANSPWGERESRERLMAQLDGEAWQNLRRMAYGTDIDCANARLRLPLYGFEFNSEEWARYKAAPGSYVDRFGRPNGNVLPPEIAPLVEVAMAYIRRCVEVERPHTPWADFNCRDIEAQWGTDTCRAFGWCGYAT